MNLNLNHVFDVLNIGIVILDRELKVRHWNNWMAMHSGIPGEKIIGSGLLGHFPNLDNPRFIRSFNSVLKLGNFYFFSQKLHRYLFPMKTFSPFGSDFEFMQQSCTMCPLRDENNAVNLICITIQDVTEIASYEQQLIEMNLRDSLTGAYNRRFFTVRLSEEFERHRRYARSLSVLMIDIDFFKRINDRFGHQCGDFVLKSISAGISAILRRVDILVRYGGEEFCCLLPETGLEPALVLAERIRLAIEAEQFVYNDLRIKVTVSIGVHEFKDNIDSPDILLKKADEALYLAKKSGRNQVVSLA